MGKILKFLLYLLNRLTNKFNELYEKYENVKRKIDSLENLKIMNSKEYIQVLARKNISKYFFLEIFVVFLFIMLLKLNPTFTNSDFLWPTILWPILYLVVLLFLVGSLYYCLTKFFVSLVPLISFKKNCFFKIIYNLFPELNWLKHYALLVPIVIFSILISLFISILVGKNNYLGIGISVLIATRMMIWILKGIIKSQPSFRFGDYNSSPTTILAILAILGLILGGIDWEKNYFWSLTIIIVTISSQGIKVVIDDLNAEGEQKAQEIFQEQLLLKSPNYGKLKKCYYHGGEKYKEKLLSNEKFLKVIMASEIGLLNVMETYEDYILYKEVKYKNYLESQK